MASVSLLWFLCAYNCFLSSFIYFLHDFATRSDLKSSELGILQAVFLQTYISVFCKICSVYFSVSVICFVVQRGDISDPRPSFSCRGILFHYCRIKY